MKILNQVCTIDQAFKLKNLGVRQDCSAFKRMEYWVGGTHLSLMESYIDNYDWEKHPDYIGQENELAFFTSAELGVMLPYFFDTRKVQSGNILTKQSYPDMYMCHSTDEGQIAVTGGKSIFPTEAIAKADMLIFLLEVKAIEVDDVNKRLEVAENENPM